MRTVGGSGSWEISVLSGPGLWRPSREKNVAGLRPRGLETPPGWGERAVPGPARLQPRPRSGRTWEAAPGAGHGGLPGAHGARATVLSRGALWDPAPWWRPCPLPPQPECVPGVGIYFLRNNFFFFFFSTEETAVQRGYGIAVATEVAWAVRIKTQSRLMSRCFLLLYQYPVQVPLARTPGYNAGWSLVAFKAHGSAAVWPRPVLTPLWGSAQRGE